MPTRERILLGLAVIGFVVPNAMVIGFLVDNGLDLNEYFGAWFDSLPSTQLTLDLVIAFTAFALWAAWDGQRLGMRAWWAPIPASLLVGLCFGVPLYLFMRERQTRAAPAADPDRAAPAGRPARPT